MFVSSTFVSFSDHFSSHFHRPNYRDLWVHDLLCRCQHAHGTLFDWKGTQSSFFFISAYIMFTGLVFYLWWRDPPKEDETEETASTNEQVSSV